MSGTLNRLKWKESENVIRNPGTLGGFSLVLNTSLWLGYASAHMHGGNFFQTHNLQMSVRCRNLFGNPGTSCAFPLWKQFQEHQMHSTAFETFSGTRLFSAFSCPAGTLFRNRSHVSIVQTFSGTLHLRSLSSGKSFHSWSLRHSGGTFSVIQEVSQQSHQPSFPTFRYTMTSNETFHLPYGTRSMEVDVMCELVFWALEICTKKLKPPLSQWIQVSRQTKLRVLLTQERKRNVIIWMMVGGLMMIISTRQLAEPLGYPVNN